MSWKFIVSANHDGRRLDKVIRSLWPALPLSALMKNIRKGRVRVDSKKASFDTRLSRGQEVYVPWDKPDSREEGGVDKKLETVWRNSDLWVVNKPSGLLSQPSKKGEDSLLSRSWADKDLLSEDFRPALVNRLDRNTTGLVLIALGGNVLRKLQEAMKQNRIRKDYLAVVCGEIPKEGRIDKPLFKDPSKNTVVVDSNGKPSISIFKRLCTDGQFSLVEIRLVTGRSHQARVHLADMGFPIIGDQKYGNRNENRHWWQYGIKRPLLHASCLSFPDLGKEFSRISEKQFKAPLPEDMIFFFSRRGWDSTFLV